MTSFFSNNRMPTFYIIFIQAKYTLTKESPYHCVFVIMTHSITTMEGINSLHSADKCNSVENESRKSSNKESSNHSQPLESVLVFVPKPPVISCCLLVHLYMHCKVGNVLDMSQTCFGDEDMS